MAVYIKNQIQNINYFKLNRIKIKEINFLNADRYKVVAEDEDYLVKLYPLENYDFFKKLALNIDNPIEKGNLDTEKVYEISSFYESIGLDEYLKSHKPEENYKLGKEFSNILKKIHSLSPDQYTDWADIFTTRTNYLFYMHGVNDNIGDDDYILIDYINANKHLTKNIRQRYIINKINYESILVDEQGEIIISDLDFKKVGDRVYDFSRLNKFYLHSPDFIKGLYDGYFDKEKASGKFFRLLALYQAYSILKSMVDLREGKKARYSEEDIKQLLNIYDNFNTDVPNWIKEGY